MPPWRPWGRQTIRPAPPIARDHPGVRLDKVFGDLLPFLGVGVEQCRRAASLEHGRELPPEVERVLHGHVHALTGLRGVGVAPVPGDEDARRTCAHLVVGDVVELVGHCVADPIDREPRGLVDLERVRSQDTLGLFEDLARQEPGVGRDLTHVHVRPVVFASAGVGITPMAGMMSHLAAAGSGLQIMVLHADEHEGTVALRRQVVSDVLALPNASLHVWYAKGTASHEPVDGVHAGLMNLADVTLPDNAWYYLCGPIPFMQAVAAR